MLNLLGIGKSYTMLIYVTLAIAIFSAGVVVIRKDARDDVVTEIDAAGKAATVENIKEDRKSDDKIDNLTPDDLVDFGCKWLHFDDPDYCG